MHNRSDRDANTWSSYEFERFAGDVLGAALNIPRASMDRGDRFGIDYVAEDHAGNLVLVEIKSDTPSTQGRIEVISEQFKKASDKIGPQLVANRILVVPGVIRQSGIDFLSSRGIEVISGPDLFEAAERANIPTPEGIQVTRPPVRDVPAGHLLRSRLREIKPGRDAWVAYQKLCTEACEYLFSPPLGVPRPELSDGPGVNRRDAIMANYADSGYWHFMRTHYHADFVVMDAKNYRRDVKKQEVLQLANYLSLRGTGLFGMIITRLGADTGATWTMREQWVLHSKLIIVIDDNDLNQMLTARDADAEPWAVIRQKIEDFRLSI
ncbi:hypothetical protein [Lentzea sp. NPDC055074]